MHRAISSDAGNRLSPGKRRQGGIVAESTTAHQKMLLLQPSFISSLTSSRRQINRTVYGSRVRFDAFEYTHPGLMTRCIKGAPHRSTVFFPIMNPCRLQRRQIESTKHIAGHIVVCRNRNGLRITLDPGNRSQQRDICSLVSRYFSCPRTVGK